MSRKKKRIIVIILLIILSITVLINENEKAKFTNQDGVKQEQRVKYN